MGTPLTCSSIGFPIEIQTTECFESTPGPSYSLVILGKSQSIIQALVSPSVRWESDAYVKVVVRIKQDACMYIHVYMPDTKLLLQSQMVIGVPIRLISNQMVETGSGSPPGPWCTEGDTGERECHCWAWAGLGEGLWRCGHRPQKEEV